MEMPRFLSIFSICNLALLYSFSPYLIPTKWSPNELTEVDFESKMLTFKCPHSLNKWQNYSTTLHSIRNFLTNLSSTFFFSTLSCWSWDYVINVLKPNAKFFLYKVCLHTSLYTHIKIHTRNTLLSWQLLYSTCCIASLMILLVDWTKNTLQTKEIKKETMT